MLRLFILFFWLWSSAAWSLNVAVQKTVLSNLQQAVGVAVNPDGVMALLDGNGLTLVTNAGQVLSTNPAIPASALSVFFYHDQWFAADPVSGHLLRLNKTGGLVQTIDVRGTANSKKPPEPVAISVYQDVIYWADRANHRICRYDLPKQTALDCFGQRGETDGEFQYPYQMAFDRDGYLNVVDIANARIQVFDKKGRFVLQIGHFGSGKGDLFRPNGIAIDSQHDLLFVSDSYFGTIKLFRAGEALGELTDAKGTAVKLKSPTSLAWHNGVLFVADTLSSEIIALKIDGLDKIPVVLATESSADPSQKNCQMCHLSWAKVGNEPDKQNMLPEASFIMCYSCHNGAIWDSRFQIGKNGQHASVYDTDELKKQRHEQKRKDKLPDIFPRTESKDLPCTSCHTPHTKGVGNETLYEGHKNAWLRVTNKGGDLCERCHESKIKQAREPDVKKRGYTHPLAIKLTAPPTPEAKGYAKDKNLHEGLPKALAEAGGVLGHQDTIICQSCHQVHGGHGDRDMTALPSGKDELCVTCHERQASKDQEDAHKKGVHPIMVKFLPPPTPDTKGYAKDENLHKGLPKTLQDAGAVQGEDKTLLCRSCHEVHGGEGISELTVLKTDKSELCIACHERQASKDKEDARCKGVHPVNVKPDKPMKKDGHEVKFVTCTTCHNVHTGKPDTALLEKGMKDAEALCHTCHDRQDAKDKDDAFKKGVHPVNMKMDDEVEIDGKKTRKVLCLTCHAVHTGKPNTPALVEDHQDGQLCSHCHAGKQAIVGSDHDLRITAKDKESRFKEKPKAGVCSACHTLHRGENKVAHLYSAIAVAEDTSVVDKELQHSKLKEDQLCINCHQKKGVAEKKVVKAFTHPHKNVVLRSDKTVMPLLDDKEKANEFGEIACITCHDPHFWNADKLQQAKKQPKSVVAVGNKDNVEGTPLTSFLRTKGIKGTFCVDCHALEAQTKYKYYHDPKLVRNIGVDYLK
ncbi:MAG: NHL repeat-containing protein [Methylococcales bacterium]|nr:NHL repeat-containing protein [Methylococcales bacterium]